MGATDVVLMYYWINIRLEDLVKHQCDYLKAKESIYCRSP